MLDTEFAPWPCYSKEESEIISSVLLSNRVNYWTGERGRTFERDFADYVGARHAVALANGTLALELALRALNIGPGDEVVVTPRSFVASVSAVVMVGAIPVFADVDKNTQNLCPATIRPVLSERTRAIIAVHLAGWPCDMDGLMALAEEHRMFVIEDCAQSHGARYRGRSVGALGHVAAWSFCQDKIVTTGGEGGMVTTNDAQIWRFAWEFKDHGKSWDAVQQARNATGYRWLHESFGSNWRMTEMQAAIGSYQLTCLDDWHAARRENAQRLKAAFDRFPAAVRIPMPPDDIDHAWYRFYVFLIPESLNAGWSRNRILEEIRRQGVPCGPGSCSEIYLEKAFDGTGYRPRERLPIARELGETSMMFLVHPTLTDRDMTKAVEVIDRVMSLATI
ncbi:MAG: DegT/DnrJ/EryC1/StrS aminotransferase family protein [Gammaproteobacteria bacterium]|nr:DegT/DnrJ/EryC1/StrS aminotransferase family protein [Gammaproteobacteria bacterium]